MTVTYVVSVLRYEPCVIRMTSEPIFVCCGNRKRWAKTN